MILTSTNKLFTKSKLLTTHKKNNNSIYFNQLYNNMSYKEKYISQLRKGYTPIENTPKKELASIFKSVFKRQVDRKDLDFFIELHETNEVVLRAWSFLGLHNILKERSVLSENKELKIQKIILDILKDKREICYYGGSSEIQTSLREHHARRIVDLNNSLVFQPVLEYFEALDGEIDETDAELIEKVLSCHPDPILESIILQFAQKIDKSKFDIKNHIINAFDNLSQVIDLKERDTITNLFKKYLKDSKEIKSNDTRFHNKKFELQKNILRVGALLDLDLEGETLEFLELLQRPYDSLDQIAKRYRNNNRFISIMLNKLEESNNPHFIAEILKAILIIKDNIKNWKELILENIKKYQILDGDLLAEVQDSDIFNEEMMINFLNARDSWYLEFLREYLIYNPEILDNWQNLKEEFIKILNADDPHDLKEQKELILKLVIDLKRKDLVKYCLKNFEILKEEDLKKLAVFPILKFGEEDLLLELKELMKNDEETKRFVLNFWNRLQRNDWRFFY